jgi:hypothetical protein
MIEEANEEFKQTERNPELKTQTPQGNMGRTYKGKEYLGNIIYLINRTLDILRNREKRNLGARSIDANKKNYLFY